MTIERYIPRPDVVDVLVIEESTTKTDVQAFVLAMVPVTGIDTTIMVWGTVLLIGDRISKTGSIYRDFSGMQSVPAGTLNYTIEVQA